MKVKKKKKNKKKKKKKKKKKVFHLLETNPSRWSSCSVKDSPAQIPHPVSDKMATKGSYLSSL
jgi:hypothetical protein